MEKNIIPGGYPPGAIWADKWSPGDIREKTLRRFISRRELSRGEEAKKLRDMASSISGRKKSRLDLAKELRAAAAAAFS